MGGCGASSDTNQDADSTTTSFAAADTTTTLPSAPTTIQQVTTSTTVAGEARTSPCAITDAVTVAEHFGGTVSEGIEGFADNCTYGIRGGIGGTQKVDVFLVGAAETWESVLARYEETRGGVIEVNEVGEAAFHPVDHGVRDIVFRDGSSIYSIVAFGGATEEQLVDVETAVKGLASAIAGG